MYLPSLRFPLWPILSVILLVFLFGGLHIVSGFADPDAFYHIKMAMRLFDSGIQTDFNWLPFTVLQNGFCDHHFLYHIFLSLFLFFFPPFIALKVCTLLLSVLTIIVFYLFLKRFSIPYAFIITVLLVFSAHYLFRINLAKTISLSNIFMILTFFCLFEKRFISLFFLSFGYVWLYGGFILVFLFYGCYVFSLSVVHLLKQNVSFLKNCFHPYFILMGGLILLGVLLGLLFSPYFPSNLSFYFQQIFEIGILNKGHEIIVGMEWAPYPLWDLFTAHYMVFLLYVFSIVSCLSHLKNMNGKVLFFFLLSIFFLLFTLKSKRYVEYLIPVMLLFSGFSLKQWVSLCSLTDVWKRLKREMKAFNLIKKVVTCLLLVYLVGLFGASCVRSYLQVAFAYENSFSYDRLEGAAMYLKTHSVKGDIVFHTAFDEFPSLFYYNDVNYYISGLDSTFFYNADPEKYWLWEDLILGKVTDNLYNVFTEEFDAKYVLVARRWNALNPLLYKNEGFSLVYVDEEASIYRVKDGE